MRIELEGSDSLPYGGDHVTLAVFRILKRRLAMALADPRRSSGLADEAEAGSAVAFAEPGRFLLPRAGHSRRFAATGSRDDAAREIRERWQELEARLLAERLPAGLDDAVNVVVPTRFWGGEAQPIQLAAKHSFGWLWDRAENIKRDLFRAANRSERDLSLRHDADDELQAGIALAEVPEEVVGGIGTRTGLEGARAWVTVGEIHRCIAPSLEQAPVIAPRRSAPGPRAAAEGRAVLRDALRAKGRSRTVLAGG